MKKTLMVVAAIAVTSAALLSAQSLALNVKRDPNYTVPRTPWGDPDLQGKWPSTDMVGTPMQRDAKLGTRNLLTEAEYKEVQARFARQHSHSRHRHQRPGSRRQYSGSTHLGGWRDLSDGPRLY